ncbi:F-box-like domain superfamily [Sesbania bispinosa]|nr:F-box-like domain superfamily [Sesbania bispinosa]
MIATMSPPPSSNSTSKSNTTINNLFDDSLIEIFRRLPCKSLFICKSVSKRWFALVSDSDFHSLYLTHQHSLFQNAQAKGEELDQNGFFLEPYNAFVITPKVPSLQFGSLKKHVSLSFLGADFEPTTVIPELRSVLKFVLGSSNGLLLCGHPRPYKKCIYRVCNPLTKDSLELPCSLTACDNAGVLVGFTCDPYYRFQNEVVSVVASQRRFRVVRIPSFTDTRFSFNVEVFYSETGKWNQFVVSCPKGFACGFFLMVASVEHDGKLYFKGGGRILVYDPYSNEHVASVIDLPSGFGESYRGCIGVSCGCLWLSEFPIACTASIGNRHVYRGRVWELQCGDCGNGEAIAEVWRLVHEFSLCDIVGPIFKKLKAIEREIVKGRSRILAFHPYVRDTVFLMFGDHILSCNLLTHRFKATEYDGLALVFYPITTVALPWWPTPIPSLHLSVDHCV